MAQNIRNQTIKGLMWTFFEKISTQAVTFVISIILARLLTPDDYGTIGLLMVFVSFAQLFVDSGFATGLIRKPSCSVVDFSTAFWFNIAVASILYLALFLSAPSIASFYNQPRLIALARVLGLSLIVSSFYAVQVARLTRELRFRLQAGVTVATTAVGGVVGIILAFTDFGVWALVAQILITQSIAGFAYWMLSGWRPNLSFSRGSLAYLWNFGVNYLGTNVLNSIYRNLTPLIVAKKFSALQLGYLSRAEGLANIPGGVFNSTVGRVFFPILCRVQDDEKDFVRAYKRCLRIVASSVVPAMVLIAAVAPSLVEVLLGDKWLPSVPLLTLLSIGYMLDPIISINYSALYARGHSDLAFRLEVFKKILAIIILIITVQYGIKSLCVGRVFYSCIAFFINLRFIGFPVLGLSVIQQIRDIAIPFIGAGGMYALIRFVDEYLFSFLSVAEPGFYISLIRLISEVLIGTIFYLIFSVVFKLEILDELKVLFLNFRKRTR